MSEPQNKIVRSVLNNLVNLDYVRQLVQRRLGCGCPEEVFDSVVVGVPGVFEAECLNTVAEILVGRKLLVALVDRAALDDLGKNIEQLLISGKQRRDKHGLNRFRLAIIGEVDADERPKLEAIAASIGERVHVHFLDRLQ